MRPIRSLFTSASVFALLAMTATATLAQQSAPSSASPRSVSVDNSGVNKRDRSSHTKKPTDQPNDKSDIHLAAAVRRAVVKDKSLSMSAHNVKLVAAQGAVTLRGPVKSVDEKNRVEADVKRVSGVSSVNNQLDVKN
ncbi:MAG: BON domain-containing protein [Pseudomonadota bacterium]|nr:BON domain-containing protein [Pseudomonadota bacterium]